MRPTNFTTDSSECADVRSDFRLLERDTVILDHLPLVRSIAMRVYESLPVHVDVDDLIHAGIMGLIDAVTKYRNDRNVSFHLYARHRIKGAILDSLRDMDWATRDLRRRHKQFENVTRQLTATMERTPTEAEIAEAMGMDVARWREVALDMRMSGLLSASTRPPESDNQTTPEFPASDRLNPDVLTEKSELRSMLSSAMKQLPQRHQEVIGMYYLGGRTMREIGACLGINESRVCQIHRAALDKMNASLQSAGIHSTECFL